ncbi:MAG TPA: FHA domain-containing protein, partial [Microthrixaceae bacterium]|nr:FHA domain-containing protein [Microthrixaceae bacterium]
LVPPSPPTPPLDSRTAARQLVMTVYMADGRSWAVAVSGGTDLGRESDLLIPDDLASRRHARVDPVDGYWIISDLDSLNGTAVNGVHIQSAPLSPGDHVTIGGTVLVVEAT